MTITPYANAGTGASASVLGTDRCGVITLTTGIGSSSGIQFHCTFDGDGTFTADSNVRLEPLGTAPTPSQIDSNGSGGPVSRGPGTGFFVNFSVADTTEYQFAYSID